MPQLTPLQAAAGGKKEPPQPPSVSLTSFAAIFILFIVVSSDVFVDGVLAPLGWAAGASPTAAGVMAQGVMLVLGYALVLYLLGKNLI